MQNVLVLGAGQVGTVAARAVAEMGACVVAADINPLPSYFARFGPRRGARLLTADILEASAVSPLLTAYAIDTIILSAGLLAEAAANDVAKAWEVNVMGAEVVAQAALSVGIKRLVFVSSFAVYGRPPANLLSETLRPQPQSEYGRTKAAAESVLVPLRNEGVDVRIIRPCGIYGPRPPGCGSHSAQFIDSLLLCALNGQEVIIKATQNSSDEYLYVEDLGLAIALVALSDAYSPEFIFNVGAGRKTTVQDLCLALRRIIPNARLEIEMTSDGERSIPPLDVSRMRESFGFERRYDLIEGLSDYLRKMRV